MPIYEKSTNQLLTEYIKANLNSGQVIDKDQIVGWFKTNYPKIKSNTVNCHIIDEEDSTITGVEFEAGGKRIDILAVDKDNNYVIIELKVSRGYEKVIGQILRYRAWVRKNLAGEQGIRGVIIAKVTDDLMLAASETKDIELFEYDLKIDLRRIV